MRHGQSSANAGGWFAGHTDAPLTELGRHQAEQARSNIDARDHDRVLTSDLSRAIETAAILIGTYPIDRHASAALRERACGQWEGRSLGELDDSGEIEVLRSFDGRPPDGESLRDVAVRALRHLASHADAPRVLVVCHGALMRAVIGVLDGLDPAQIGQWKPGNCEVVVREADATRLAALADALLAGDRSSVRR